MSNTSNITSYILITVFLVFSCNQPNIEEQPVSLLEVKKDITQSPAKELDSKTEENIKNIPAEKFGYYCDSTIINGIKFKACTKKENGKLFVIKKERDTIEFPVENGGPEFLDFNKDGYDDLYIHYITNVPNVHDVALYNPKNNRFELVDNLQSYPSPKKLTGTQYYYSYHRSGCADMNWDSDLFYIQKNKTIKIGNIEGSGCGDEKQGISIYSIRGDTRKLVDTFPIDTIGGYEKFKWGFIEDYWKNNINKFK